jgi:hypothetical protein
MLQLIRGRVVIVALDRAADAVFVGDALDLL